MKNAITAIGYDKIPKEGNTDSTAIICIAGTGCQRGILRFLANELTTGDVFLVDLPAHGDCPVKETGLNEYTIYITNFIARLKREGYKKVFLVGHSLGGTIVMNALAHNITYASGGIVISGAAKFDEFDPEFVDGLKNGEILLDKLLGDSPMPPAEIDGIKLLDSEEITLVDYLIDSELDITSDLMYIDTPILYLVGTEDEIITKGYIEILENNIKYFSKELFEGYTHALPVTLPKEVANHIDKFIKEI